MKKLQGKSSRYWLAHKKLPRYIFNNTESFIEGICEESDEKCYRFINLLWERAQREVGEKPSAYMPQVIKREVEGIKVVVLTMPLPKEGLEAFYTAIVYNKEKEVRYFVLENSLTKCDGALACTCEWTKNSEHINYGFTKNIELENLIKFAYDEFVNNDHKPQSMSCLDDRMNK